MHPKKSYWPSTKRKSLICSASLLKTRRNLLCRKILFQKRRSRNSSLIHLKIKRRRLKISQSWWWQRSRPRWNFSERRLRLKKPRSKHRSRLSSRKSSAQVLRKWSRIKLKHTKKHKNWLFNLILWKRLSKGSKSRISSKTRETLKPSVILNRTERTQTQRCLISLKKFCQCKSKWRSLDAFSMCFQLTSSQGPSRVFKFLTWYNKSWMTVQSMWSSSCSVAVEFLSKKWFSSRKSLRMSGMLSLKRKRLPKWRYIHKVWS